MLCDDPLEILPLVIRILFTWKMYRCRLKLNPAYESNQFNVWKNEMNEIDVNESRHPFLLFFPLSWIESCPYLIVQWIRYDWSIEILFIHEKLKFYAMW